MVALCYCYICIGGVGVDFKFKKWLAGAGNSINLVVTRGSIFLFQDQRTEASPWR